MAQKLHQSSSKITLSHEAAYHAAITNGFALLDIAIDDKKLKKVCLMAAVEL